MNKSTSHILDRNLIPPGHLNVRSRFWVPLTYLLLFVYGVLIIWTFLDYGITYDEDWHLKYGEHIIQWYASGFQDKSALTYWTLPLQGGFFGTLSRLVSRMSPLGDFETSHLVNGIFGVLGIFGVYKLGRLLAGPFAGFLSALFLLVTPRFYGHAFNNPVDIPMATLSIFAIYYLVSSVKSLPRPPGGLILKLGVVVGLALAVRVGAVILVGYVGIAFFLWIVSRHLSQAGNGITDVDVRSYLLKISGTFLIVCTIAYLTMLLWWPAAQVRPVFQPAKGLWYATHFGYPIDVFFDGTVLSNTNLPWYYLLKWFLITLPEFYFIALSVGLVLAVRSLLKHRTDLSSLNTEYTLGILIVLIAALFPIAYTAITVPVEYDGIRHYLFIIPPLAVIAAVSVAESVKRLSSPFAIAPVMALILASLALTGMDMVELHPHQYVFFNRIFGKGVAQAAELYETDYWGNSYKEGVEWIAQHYKNQNNGRKIKVASCLYSLSTSYFLPKDRFEYVGTFDDGQPIVDDVEPDLFLATTRWNCQEKLKGRLLHTITRKGAPLLYIIEVSNDHEGLKEKNQQDSI